jgi:hypothetical protein
MEQSYWQKVKNVWQYLIIPKAREVGRDFLDYGHKVQSVVYSGCRMTKYRLRDLYRRMNSTENNPTAESLLNPEEKPAEKVSEEERENFKSHWGERLDSGTAWLGNKAWDGVKKLQPAWEWFEPKMQSVKKHCKRAYRKWRPEVEAQAKKWQAKANAEYKRLAPQVKAKSEKIINKAREDVQYYAPRIKAEFKEFVRHSKESIRRIKKPKDPNSKQ